MEISAEEQALCTARPQAVDHGRVASLHYIGNYTRVLPVSMTRMLENARDWEHLPHVHASSFSEITLVSNGRWGWRAKARQAARPRETQLLELLIDYERNYWATAILSGSAAGVEIHTTASTVTERSIRIEVKFYIDRTLSQEESAVYHDVLQQQYALLYDEDGAMMRSRQFALDQQQILTKPVGDTKLLWQGDSNALSKSGANAIDTASGRYCIRFLEGAWIAHSATCPHQLGPLQDCKVEPGAIVTCPWHGYRFNILTGKNLEGRCSSLPTATVRESENGILHLTKA